MINWPVLTQSESETERLGQKFAASLAGGEVVILSGGLGSGKTTFTKGLALGLDVADSTEVSSPSYTLINEYAGRLNLIHVDLYRLDHDQEVIDLALEDLISTHSVMAVEWGEKLPMTLGKTIHLSFRITGDSTREIAPAPD